MTDTFARMRQLTGTTAEWTTNDLVIGLGEFALERTAGGAQRLKVGNGVAKFSELPYFDPGIFSYVLKGGDTMTGPLVVPGVTVNAGGLIVSAGNSSFTAPVNLGANATATTPTNTDDDDESVATTHWVQQRVGGIITGLHLKGTWDASTNTPPLASGGGGVPAPVRGDFYLVSVSGSTTLDGISTWNAGDSVVFNGVSWQRVPQTLFASQIVAALGYTPADDADLTTLEGTVATLNSDAVKRQIVDAAGDLIVGTAADTVARLARGANGQILQAGASSIAWATPSGWRSLGAVNVSSAAAQVDFTNLPTDVNHLMAFYDLSPTTNDVGLLVRAFDGTGTIDAAANYPWSVVAQYSGAALNAPPSSSSSTSSGVNTGIMLSQYQTNNGVHNGANGSIQGRLAVTNIRAIRVKGFSYESSYLNGTNAYLLSISGGGRWNNNTSFLGGLRFLFSGGTVASGAVTLWGSP